MFVDDEAAVFAVRLELLLSIDEASNLRVVAINEAVFFASVAAFAVRLDFQIKFPNSSSLLLSSFDTAAVRIACSWRVEQTVGEY